MPGKHARQQSSFEDLPYTCESAMGLLSKIFRRSKSSSDAVLSRRLEQSIGGAGYWATRMPREAVRLTQQVQLRNVVATAIIFSTGLMAWPLISHASPLTAQVVLSALSGVSALAIAAPHVTGLSDRTEEAIKLCGSYATIHGELLRAQQRLSEGSAEHKTHVAELIRQYENVMARKDAALPLSGRRSGVRPRARLQPAQSQQAHGNAPHRTGRHRLEPSRFGRELNPSAGDR
ncbi:hypothetical protein [Streptomyces sp. HC307]|uniref:hypothetical protein n=1 Tax=Streptomyces flavusporus TaxID=3385496 RepID=UPI00391703D2